MSLGISFKVEGPGPAAFLRSTLAKVDSRVDEIVAVAAEAGAEQMELNIRSRRQSRTGKMANGVSVDRRGSNQYARKARFGWLKDPEDYFLYQEEGFWHVNSGESIEGMFAMGDAFYEAEQLATEAINDLMRGS